MNVDRVIQVEGLTKAYGDLLAVDQISFEVQEGEIFGFLGPNGAGKTTTIRMLTGLSQPTAGAARVLGYEVRSEIVQAKKHLGVVPEQSNLYDELTAMGNLLFMGKLYGVPRGERRKRAEELLRMFRLEDRENSPFATLSRGMRRALTIAAALVHRPKLLFLDEPTVGLDVAAARSLRALVAGLRDQGVTVFLTTHYLEEADLLCDRIAILVSGKVVRTGTPTELKGAAEEGSVIEVSFQQALPQARERLAEVLPGAEVVEMNAAKLRILGGDPAEVYTAIFRLAEEKDVGIARLSTVQPSLEDAFIQITGLSPAVMAQEKGK
ncbi:MAG: ABC transporter ATP-binding protein [Candidatus Bipolaricaulis anaerobius]|nr:ABC transporter ATP-binding protein [Candidatus Bipolaricaulis anaerobius]